MKPHYFDSEIDEDDIQLKMAIGQGYVPDTCRLGGPIVMGEMNKGNDPCVGCTCDRNKCFGRPEHKIVM
jgi:hypothetical protein